MDDNAALQHAEHESGQISGGVTGVVFQPPAQQLNHHAGDDLRQHVRRKGQCVLGELVDQGALDDGSQILPPEGV